MMFWTDIARFLQYFINLSNSFINIFAILQDFNGIFSKYSFNITVLCGLCTLWVSHTLFDEQRENRVKWCKKMLKKFKSGFAAEVNFIATGNEKWLYYYNVRTESQSKVWVFEDEEVPMQVRKLKSIGKRMFAVFFSKGGILTTVLLEKSKTVTTKWYTKTCLPQLFENLVFRAPLDSFFLHYANAPAHRAFAM